MANLHGRASGVRDRTGEAKGVERKFGWLLTGDGAGSGRVVGEEEEDEEAEEREEGDEGRDRGRSEGFRSWEIEREKGSR